MRQTALTQDFTIINLFASVQKLKLQMKTMIPILLEGEQSGHRVHDTLSLATIRCFSAE